MSHIKTLEVLNDCSESQKILLKLPDWLVSSWNCKAMEIRQTRAVYPSFKELVNFLSKEADLACDPITSIQALKVVEIDKPKHPRSQTLHAKTLSTNTIQNSIPSCVFCRRTGHVLAKCIKFCEKTDQDRVKFVQTEKLCFGCLKTGHQSRRCEKKSTCEKCQRRHTTCLHDDNFKEHQRSTPPRGNDKVDTKEVTATATTNRVIQRDLSTHTSPIVPVWVSSEKQPDQEILVYALLDTQSDTTFILDEVAQDLDTNKGNTHLQLSTMTARSTVIPCQKLTNLQVRGYNQEKRIPLPSVFTWEFIPVDRLHIPNLRNISKMVSSGTVVTNFVITVINDAQNKTLTLC